MQIQIMVPPLLKTFFITKAQVVTRSNVGHNAIEMTNCYIMIHIRFIQDLLQSLSVSF